MTAVKEKFPPLTSSSTSCWSHAESDIYFLLYAVKICASESASLCVCVSVLVQASACVCVHNSICVFPPLPFTLARVEMEVPLPGPTHWTLLRKPLSVGYWTAWMQLKSNMRERGMSDVPSITRLRLQWPDAILLGLLRVWQAQTTSLLMGGRMPQLRGVPGGKWVLIEIAETTSLLKAKVNLIGFTHLNTKNAYTCTTETKLGAEHKNLCKYNGLVLNLNTFLVLTKMCP